MATKHWSLLFFNVDYNHEMDLQITKVFVELSNLPEFLNDGIIEQYK